MSLGIPPVKIQILLESNPRKSAMLVGRFAVPPSAIPEARHGAAERGEPGAQAGPRTSVAQTHHGVGRLDPMCVQVLASKVRSFARQGAAAETPPAKALRGGAVGGPEAWNSCVAKM